MDRNALKCNDIAVLLTCFNRKDKTIGCLRRLFEVSKDFQVYLVDDNSTDGTAREVRQRFPKVNVIEGNGDLYWNRGMCLAWEKARQKNFKYYLWLNDDVLLHDFFLVELLSCAEKIGPLGIVSGIIEGVDSEVLYGGSDRKKTLLTPNGRLQDVAYLNGNVVLISDSVYNKIGPLDPTYHHDLGDVDYGLRAIRNDIRVVTTTRFVGIGEKNALCRVRKAGVTLPQRFRRLYSPLGSPPFLSFYFRVRHFGRANAIIYFLFLHIINIAPDWIVRRVYGEKYF